MCDKYQFYAVVTVVKSDSPTISSSEAEVVMVSVVSVPAIDPKCSFPMTNSVIISTTMTINIAANMYEEVTMDGVRMRFSFEHDCSFLSHLRDFLPEDGISI